MKVIKVLSVVLFAAALIFLFSGRAQNSPQKNHSIIESFPASRGFSDSAAHEQSSGSPALASLAKEKIKIAPQTQAQIDSLDEYVHEFPPENMDMIVLSDGHDDDILVYSENFETLQNLFLKGDSGNHFAHESEGQYLDLITSSEYLAEYALKETSCRADSCKVSFHVEDDLQHARLVNDFLRVLSEKGDGLSVMVDPAADGNVASFYVGLSVADK